MYIAGQGGLYLKGLIMTKALMCVTGCLLMVCAILAADGDFDFRKVRWGMSKAEVIASEEHEFKIVPGSGGEGLISKKKHRVANLDALIAYVFAEDKLIRAVYLFQEVHTNRNDYIMDFKNVKELLTKKYGEPVEDTVLWRSDLFKNDYDQWGTATSIGHTYFYSQWDAGETFVVTSLSGENYEITCKLEYSSKDLAELGRKKDEESAMEGL